MGKSIRFPIPTYSMNDKRIDYTILLWIILISNRDNNNSDKIKRYLYLNKLNENMDIILENLKIKRQTFSRKLKKIIDTGIIELNDDYNEYYNIICKNALKENGYILLEKDKIINILNDNLSNNEIKTYFAIIELLGGANQKEISREEISERTSLSKRTISNTIKILESKKYINTKFSNSFGKNNYYTYRLNTF